jgi:poly-beta-1,6-N-acetyl-D-glucosamine synthase
MTGSSLSYALVTPARNEHANLERLADCLFGQLLRPDAWVIVDNGSTDATAELARELAGLRRWVHLIEIPAGRQERGGPIVRAFHAGVARLDRLPDVVVKLDADVSMAPDYFDRLMQAFAADPLLGIASGSCYEYDGEGWRQQHMTGSSVWGCARAYRTACLEEILPLEEQMGWDGIDVLKAEVRGWNSGIQVDLPFRHHRVEGARDGARRSAYAAQGRAAHYMGYRTWYLVARALNRSRTEPAALAMIGGFAAATAMRRPRCADPQVVAHLRSEQRLTLLPARIREAAGRRRPPPVSGDGVECRGQLPR